MMDDVRIYCKVNISRMVVSSKRVSATTQSRFKANCTIAVIGGPWEYVNCMHLCFFDTCEVYGLSWAQQGQDKGIHFICCQDPSLWTLAHWATKPGSVKLITSSLFSFFLALVCHWWPVKLLICCWYCLWCTLDSSSVIIALWQWQLLSKATMNLLFSRQMPSKWHWWQLLHGLHGHPCSGFSRLVWFTCATLLCQLQSCVYQFLMSWTR